MARLLERYRKEIAPALASALGRDNVHSLPRLEKVVISMGVGRAIQDSKILDEVAEHLMQLSGQRPTIREARKSVAQFKLREGMKIGVSVTLRRNRMYEFIDRLVTIVLPRVRDFRGVSTKAFDGNGNYSLGLTEQVVFPEVNADKVKTMQGMNIAIVTTARNDDEGRLLLKELGMPFRKSQNS
ncbi:MAG: 50S ribosomal protein L5 [Planctomycetaceae bacterium]